MMRLIAPDLFEQETALEHLKGLRELIERMNSVYDLEELLTFVVDKALHLTGGYRGLLLLSNDQARELREIALVRGEEPDDQRLQQALAAASSTVIQDVLARGEPRLVLDLPADRRYEGIASPETLKLKQIRSVLAVPLKVGQEPVGLIYIDHPKKAIFGQSDLHFLTAFANQAAIAIHRAREHQRKIDELTHLNELSRSVVQVLDLDKVLTKIVSAATEMLNVETGSVLLLDEDRAELYFATSVSNGRPVEISTRLRKDQGIGGWVLSNGQPVCLNDLAGDPRWYGEVEVDFNTHSLLCVPLQAEQRALGVLQVLNTKKREGFCDEDLALLSAFAASATIAIENAHLFREARQARQLRALNELALGLGKTLELKAILEFGLKQSLRLLEAEAGLINLFYHQAEPCQVSEGLAQAPALAGAQTKLLQACLDLMAQRDSDELLIIDELHAHPQLSRLDLAGVGFNALALAPLKIGRENKGVLLIMHRASRSYSEEWLSLLEGIAPIISLAVQNAIHYLEAQERTHQLIRLNDIGLALTRGVSGLDLPFVLRVIIDGVNATLHTERASIFLIDEDTGDLMLNCTNEGDVEIRLTPPWSGSIVGWVATHNQPRLLNDPLNDPDYMSDVADRVGYKIHSLLCTPILVEGRVIGVIEALNKQNGQPFYERDQEELIEFAKWAAIAIHNTRLFEQRLQAYQRLASEQRRRHAAEARSAMAAIILDIAHTMNNIIGAIRFWTLDLQDEAQARSDKLFQEGLAEILRNAEEAIELISKARHPHDKVILEPTDVQACLARAIQSCAWPSNVSRREKYEPALPLARANSQRLESVFQNLLLNGLQALAVQGGEIYLRTGVSPEGGLEIRIADNGPGIPPELQDRIFDAHFSSKEEGLGLGLWLVETFIRQIEGQINFSSSAKGTTFIITLPLWLADK